MISQIKTLYTKLIATGFGHLFGSSVINKILGLFSSVIIVRLIPKEEYGIYANANNILGFFCIFEGLGMATTFLQYGSTSEGRHKQQIWSFCFYFSLIFQVLLSFLILATSLTVEFKIKGTGYFLFLMSFLPLIRSVRSMQCIYMRTELKNKEFAITNNFNTVVTLLLSIILSFLFLVNGLILASYISTIISVLFIIYYQKFSLPNFDFSLPKKEKIELIKFSVVSAITNSASSIVYLLDTFILGIVVAQSTVTASYKVALTIPTALAFIPSCVMTYIYPHFARHADNPSWCLRNLKKVLILFGGANLLISISLVILAPMLILLIFGRQYLDSVTPMRILCINYLISATFYHVCGQLLITLKKIKFSLVLNFVVCFINIILNMQFIPQYGGTGAAIATLITKSISALIATGFLFYCYNQAKSHDIARF